MRNSFRGLPCVYCGAPAATDDHVIAGKFFLEPHRGNLPEVPACEWCNNEKSHLEDYLLVVLAFGAKHSDAAVNLGTLVRRRLEKNLRLKRELAAGYDASGGTTIPFDHRKLERLFAMIAQGLAWHHWRVLLKPGLRAIAALFNDAGAPFFGQMLSGWKTPIRTSANLGNGTFVYEGAQATDVPEATIWRFQMYGDVTFLGDPAVPGPASLAAAVTGRDGLIQRLQSKGHSVSRVVSEKEIAVHAYYHWERRGRPFGSPEVDWYWAIEDLKRPLKVGVLIIGSLCWRDEGSGEGRDKWRHCRLDMKHKWAVKVPIQYGRLSQQGTFTMVFSQLPDDQFGQAIIVPCQREVSSLEDLIVEAEWLWSAEVKNVPPLCTLSPRQSISKKWKNGGGCVALLRNPRSYVPQELLDGWADHVLKEPRYDANDRRRVGAKGALLIEWPHIAEGEPPLPDLLLATANDPEPTFPTVQQIAEAWNRHPENAEYFHKNRKNNIYTFQDDAIKERLH